MANWESGWRERGAHPYLFAVAGVMVFSVAQYTLLPFLGVSPPLALLLIPVMTSAVYGGTGPALIATTLSVAAGWFFFTEPKLSFEIVRPDDRARIFLFTFVCLCMSAMGALLARSRKETAELLLSLQESDRTTRAQLESTTQAVIGVCKDGRIRIANEAVYRMFGYRPYEIIGKHSETLVPAARRDRYVRELSAYFDETQTAPQPFEQEMQGRRADGFTFPVEANFNVVHTASGPLLVCFIADISRRKETEAALLRERSELKSIMDYSPVLVSIKDLQGRVMLANRSFLDLIGLPNENAIGRHITEIYPLDVAEQMWATDIQVLATRKPTEVELELENNLGERRIFHTVKFPVRYIDTDEPFGVCSFAMDITVQKKAEEKILHAAQHDPLTGLPNRALIYEMGNHLLGAAKRNDTKAAVLFFDLDRFKPINDTFGHAVGDKMLQEVANRLSASVRASDLVGRLGGDEFIAILSEARSESDVSRAASHLLQCLGKPYLIDGLELRTSPSIGISMYPDDGIEIDTLIRHADAAMYYAKTRGRNTFQFFTPEINQNVEKAYALEQKLRQSVHQRDFELVYQPVVDTRTMHVIGAEALIRWRQSATETLLPGQFISAAETSGLINQIGEWVIQEACRQHEVWRKLGLPPLRIAVNVSPVQFRARDFQQRVGEVITRSGVDPTCIELEVTESTVMKQVEEAARILAYLKTLGLRISLDDFGTGYSSLSYLSQLPIDKLKVDQSFIRHLHTDSRSLAITETVIALGKKLGVEVVAEGIESEDALHLLRKQGCDLGQGYLISRPLPPDHFVEWYRQTDPRQLLH